MYGWYSTSYIVSNYIDITTRICVRAGSVSVFGVGIGIRYFRRYFFHVGSVFGIGISEILVENRKFLYPTSIWRPC